MGKLRSRRGASLLAALFVFLVCSVIGIVVVTAATAAAGRASKLAENDQRYFSVASAAELLAQELSGKPVTIQRVKTTEQIRESTVYFSSEAPASPPKPTQWTVKYETKIEGISDAAQPAETTNINTGDAPLGLTAGGSEISLEDSSFLTELAVYLLFGTEKCNNNAAYERSFFSNDYEGYAANGEFTLTHSYMSENLQIEGKYWLRSDGILFIEISNAGDADSDRFTMVLTLQPSFDQSYKTSEKTTPKIEFISSGGEPVGYTETRTTEAKETKSDAVTWNVISIGEKTDVGFDSDKAAGSGGTPAEGEGA